MNNHTQREVIPYTTEEAWLAERVKDITSTEVAALPGIDVNPYMSPWELFQNKRSGEVPAFAVNERMRWGTRLQDAIAAAGAEHLNLDYKRVQDYIRLPEARVGSSFDYFVKEGAGTPVEGLMEVKNVDSLAFHNNWKEEEGSLEAPPHIELQVQHQLLVSGLPYAYIVALVGGNTLKVARRSFNPNVGRVILKKVMEFWTMVREDKAPPPDFSRDAKLISALYSHSDPGKVVDLGQDADMVGYAAAYLTAQGDSKMAEVRMAELKARMLERIVDAEKALIGTFTISAKEVAASEGTKITKEMVGTFINARKSFRGFRVTQKKEKKA